MVEPCLRKSPLAFNRCWGNAERRRSLVDREAGKELQLDEISL